jgi:hypothetical protein
MKSLLIILFITSCAQQPLRTRLIDSKRIDTYQIGIKCPNDTYYNLDTKLCHYSQPKPIIKPSKPVSRKPKAKTAINCKSVFKQVNQCMGKS